MQQLSIMVNEMFGISSSFCWLFEFGNEVFLWLCGARAQHDVVYVLCIRLVEELFGGQIGLKMQISNWFFSMQNGRK
jgi:hypothetical protein